MSKVVIADRKELAICHYHSTGHHASHAHRHPAIHGVSGSGCLRACVRGDVGPADGRGLRGADAPRGATRPAARASRARRARGVRMGRRHARAASGHPHRGRPLERHARRTVHRVDGDRAVRRQAGALERGRSISPRGREGARADRILRSAAPARRRARAAVGLAPIRAVEAGVARAKHRSRSVNSGRNAMAQVEEKVTYCRICEVYCGMIATVEDGRVTRLRPDKEHVLSRGYACPKGVTFHQVTHDPDRILHPMKREGTSWRCISWEQAVGEIGAGLKRIRDTHGPHAIGLYTGNPAGYSYSHRVFSSSWIDAVGSRNSFGAGSQDNLGDFLASKFLYGASFLQPVPDLARTRWALIVGTNPVVSQGTLMHVVDAKRRIGEIRERGGRVVVLDPRRTETARIASEHHFIRPESDAFLFLAMIRTILEDGLAAEDFLAQHTCQLPWLRDAVARYTPEAVAERTAIDATTIRRLAHATAQTEGACTFGRVVCGRFGTLAAWALEVLNLVAGNLDRPGGMVFSDGLVDMVGIVDRMGRDEYGRHRSRIGDYPELLGELPSGILADEITTPGPGQIRALVVTAGNPVLSIPNGRALGAAMEQLELGVALDFYLSETAARCHYVLPCTTYLEREDFPIFHAQLLTEPYAQWTEPVIPPQGEAKQEWEIFSLISETMGVPFLNSRAAAVVRRALRLVRRDFSPRWVIDAR